MADLGELKVKVSADIKELLKSLNDGGISLDEFAKRTSVVSSRIGKDLKSGSGQASLALTDLSRVAQDLPYGFQGIQNNLNPLLESFSRLKRETGSTGGAFKALAGSLTGVGGLGFALSIVSSAILIFQNGIAGFNKKTKEAKEGIDTFAKSLDDAKASAMATGFQLQSFVNIAKNATLPLEQRNEALKQANKLLGEHGEKLTLTNINTAAATKEIENFTQALIQQAVAAKYADRAGDLFIKKSELAKEYGVELTKLNNLQKSVANKHPDQYTQAERYQLLLINQQKNKVVDLATAYKIVRDQLGGVSADLGKANTEATLLFGQLGTHKKGDVKTPNTAKTLRDSETIADVLTNLNSELDFLNTKELAFKTDETKAKIAQINNSIEHLFKKFGLQADNPIVIDLLFKAKDIQERTDLRKEVFNIPNLPTAKIPVAVGPIEPKQLEGITKQIADFTVDVSSTLSNGLAGVGESIGQMLAGEGGNLFGGLFEMLAEGIEMFGKALIEYGIGLKVLKTAIKNPTTAILAGIGLVALGSVLKASIPKFANGVDNFRGGLAMVGERGPELVTLPRGSSVTPNHELSGLGGGFREVPYIASTKIEGKDLRIILQRADASFNLHN